MICVSSPSSGRLNAFQRVMLQWSELHPYNATHTYKIAGPARLSPLRRAIEETYWHNGLGTVELAPDGLSYCHVVDEAPDVQVLDGGDDPDRVLAALVTRELNRPFARPRCQPLRFSVIDAGPEFHYLTATYDHWVADSVAARLILRHVLGRYCGLDIPDNRRALDLYPPTYREAFAGRLSGWGLVGAALRSAGAWLGHRNAAQVAYSSTAQMAVHYELHRTRPGTVDALREFARSLDATVHDVILAALGRAMDEFLPRRTRGDQGRPLALGSIVDLRGDAERDLSQSLGAMLGYYLVHCRPGQSDSLAALTRQIAASTGPLKAGRRYLDSAVNMKVSGAIWPRLKDSVKPHFARRSMPLTAGVSNLWVRNTWIDRDAQGCVLEYHRGASTGPMLPLVLSPTTLNGQMNVGVTYRATGFSRAKIDGVMEMLMDQIEHPQGHRPRQTSRRAGRRELVH